MIKETAIQKEAIERHKFCDVCGIEITIGLACSSAECNLCGKDLCENCIGNEEETHGDYRSVTCKKCWEIGNQYRPAIKSHHEIIDELYAEWRFKCENG